MWDCGRYFVVDPLNAAGERTYPSENPTRTDRVYISSTEPALGHESIRRFIEGAGVLPADGATAAGPSSHGAGSSTRRCALSSSTTSRFMPSTYRMSFSMPAPSRVAAADTLSTYPASPFSKASTVTVGRWA